MARQLTADRLAARLAKMGGASLSAEEYGAGDDLLGDDSPAPIHDASGKVDMERLLCDLLRALGIDLPTNTDKAEFKKELYAAAMRTISERTGKGKRPGGTSSAGASGNPLIPGASAEVEPMYLALNISTIEGIADPTARQIALSLATELDRLHHDRREAARSAQRLSEAQLSEARSRRQTVINRILRLAPAVQRELEDMLNAPSMAFSVDDSGTTTDPAEATLATLERRVTEQNPHLTSIQAAAQSVALPAPNEEAAVAALSRAMGCGR